jgi:WD40 repeat protein
MRLVTALIFGSLLCCPAFSQTKPIVEDKGNFGLHVVHDSIIWHKYLEEKNQLLLIGRNNIQLIDLTNFRVIETRRLDLSQVQLRADDYDYENWPISPDGQRIVLLGQKEARTKSRTEDQQAAIVLDLQTGKQIALLREPDRIHAASWSRNGGTLMTMDTEYVDIFATKLNVSFWDGETFAPRFRVNLENVTWTYLSHDGERFFAATGKRKSFFGIKHVADDDSVVRIWKTRTGELEKTISVGDAEFHPKTREIEMTPDERFLLMVNKHKSDSSEHRLLAWEVNGGIRPIYDINPKPKIDDSRVVFSPDGKYFALDVGKNLQIYETETGRMKAELANVELPASRGWIDNQTLVNIDYKSNSYLLNGFDASSGRLLYQQKLDYATEYSSYSYPLDDGGSSVFNYTVFKPHPTKRIFLTQGDQFVKIFDSRSGELLQTVVHPLIKTDSKGRSRMTHGKTVDAADWSNDGKTLYVFSSNGQSVSLWKVIED